MTEQSPATTFAADLAKANEWINSGIPDGTPVGETLEVIAGLVDELDRLGAVPDTGQAPDRLAWIGTAAETAAAQRQARYQETACARRHHTDTTPEAGQ